MVRSDVGIYAWGTFLKASLLAKLASIFITAASFLVSRLFSMPDCQKVQLREKWDQYAVEPQHVETMFTEKGESKCHIFVAAMR